MSRTALSFLLLGSLLMLAGNASAEPIPEDIRKAIDENFVGNWEFATTFDGETTKQLVINKWLPGRVAAIGISFDAEGDEPSAAYSLLGWDQATKMIIAQGFGSVGNSWTITYDKLGDAKWVGHGVGTWKGHEWKSPVKIEWSAEGFRYEDITEGKPFIIHGKRLSPGEPEAALRDFGDFMAGTWTRTDEGQERVHKYTWGLKRNFLRSNGRKDPIEAWDGLVGIDHGAGTLGWWGYFADGMTGVLHLVNSGDDGWTFIGEVSKPEGTYHRLITIKKLSENRLRSNVIDTKDGKSTALVENQVWEKK